MVPSRISEISLLSLQVELGILATLIGQSRMVPVVK